MTSNHARLAPRGDPRIAAIRAFNRLYARRVGLLQESVLHTPFTLTQARVIWELAQRGRASPSDLAAGLDIDPGYMSRIVRSLHRRGIVGRQQSQEDRRRTLLFLTEAGAEAFRQIDEVSGACIAEMLAPLSEAHQELLVATLDTARELLSPPAGDGPAYILRPPRSGDLGWIIQSHGRAYGREHGCDWTLEAYVAGVVAGFVGTYDPARERCWIAERAGQNVGCVLVEAEGPDVARLRCLFVDPSARGLGIGRRLVEECISFARDTGYRRLVLRTAEALASARRIFEAEGFRLVDHAPHQGFEGPGLVAQNWELDL